MADMQLECRIACPTHGDRFKVWRKPTASEGVYVHEPHAVDGQQPDNVKTCSRCGAMLRRADPAKETPP